MEETKPSAKEGDNDEGGQSEANPPLVIPQSAHRVTKSKPSSKNAKAWRKPKGMPRRPLSAYNFFFRSERWRLLSVKISAQAAETNAAFDESNNPRQQTLGLGFADMARAFAKSWRGLGSADKKPFEEQARIDKVRYKLELKQWKKSHSPIETEKDFQIEPPENQDNQGHFQSANPLHATHLLHPNLQNATFYPGFSTADSLNRLASVASHQPFNANPTQQTNPFLVSMMTNPTCVALNQPLSTLDATCSMLFAASAKEHPWSSTAAGDPDKKKHEAHSLASWVDIAADLMNIPCDQCDSPEGHSPSSHCAHTESHDDDIIALVTDAPPDDKHEEPCS